MLLRPIYFVFSFSMCSRNGYLVSLFLSPILSPLDKNISDNMNKSTHFDG